MVACLGCGVKRVPRDMKGLVCWLCDATGERWWSDRAQEAEDDWEECAKPYVESSTKSEHAGYERLLKVLAEAADQCISGKGKERHANPGERFEDQQIVQVCKWLGSSQGAVFQAVKKSIESTRLPRDRAKAELLGAIVYLAGAVVALEDGDAGKETR